MPQATSSDAFVFANAALAEAIGFVADDGRQPTQEEIDSLIVALS